MAWRSSPLAICMWRIQSSIQTLGSVVPSYASMLTGLNPSGNSYSRTSSVKHRGCAALLYLGVPDSDGGFFALLVKVCFLRPYMDLAGPLCESLIGSHAA